MLIIFIGIILLGMAVVFTWEIIHSGSNNLLIRMFDEFRQINWIDEVFHWFRSSWLSSFFINMYHRIQRRNVVKHER